MVSMTVVITSMEVAITTGAKVVIKAVIKMVIVMVNMILTLTVVMTVWRWWHDDNSDNDDGSSDLLPVDMATVLFGEGCEGGAHLAALGRAVPRQVVSIIVAQ